MHNALRQRRVDMQPAKQSDPDRRVRYTQKLGPAMCLLGPYKGVEKDRNARQPRPDAKHAI